VTFDDDFVRLQMLDGFHDWYLKPLNLEWPPPLIITIDGFQFRRVDMASMTDEERASRSDAIRGAVYDSLTNPGGKLRIPLRRTP